jgi:hypothetical protein
LKIIDSQVHVRYINFFTLTAEQHGGQSSILGQSGTIKVSRKLAKAAIKQRLSWLTCQRATSQAISNR